MKLSQQFFPILLAIFTFIALCVVLFNFILFLNLLPIPDKIIPTLHVADILVGLTIYVKTSVDFALFIGNIMAKNAGIKNRIAIEIGTAVGNALGTFFVLFIWTFFKEVPLLMICMIFLAALVLLQMAQDGLGEIKIHDLRFKILETVVKILSVWLKRINTIFHPIIRFIIPHASAEGTTKKTFLSLGMFALTVPLILGLDDFAGYIPLFTIVNVFGFAMGVFLGHVLLNIALFASPTTTTKIVKQPFIALLGSLVFIGIALWGFVEILHILLQ